MWYPAPDVASLVVPLLRILYTTSPESQPALLYMVQIILLLLRWGWSADRIALASTVDACKTLQAG
jgi:hypothetical protein